MMKIYVFILSLILSGAVHATPVDPIYSNDSTGTGTFGVKQDLIDAAMEGREISVKVTFFGTPRLFKADVVQKFSNGDLCIFTQKWESNFSDWSTYTHYVTPYVISFCTDGQYNWKFNNGSSTSSGSAGYALDWYALDAEPTKIYENDKYGTDLYASKSNLIDKVNGGKKIIFKLTDLNAVYHGGEISQVWSGEVCQMIFLYAYNRSSGSVYSAAKYPFAKNICTTGKESVRGSGGYFKINQPPLSGFKMTWYALD